MCSIWAAIVRRSFASTPKFVWQVNTVSPVAVTCRWKHHGRTSNLTASQRSSLSPEARPETILPLVEISNSSGLTKVYTEDSGAPQTLLPDLSSIHGGPLLRDACKSGAFTEFHRLPICLSHFPVFETNCLAWCAGCSNEKYLRRANYDLIIIPRSTILTRIRVSTYLTGQSDPSTSEILAFYHSGIS